MKLSDLLREHVRGVGALTFRARAAVLTYEEARRVLVTIEALAGVVASVEGMALACQRYPGSCDEDAPGDDPCEACEARQALAWLGEALEGPE